MLICLTDAASLVSTVNFTTTKAGLTGQLLDVALQNDKPELEKRKSELLRAEEESKIEISKLEDFLLEQAYFLQYSCDHFIDSYVSKMGSFEINLLSHFSNATSDLI